MIEKILSILVALTVMTTAVVTMSWSDISTRISTGIENLAVACVKTTPPQGKLVAKKVIPKQTYSYSNSNYKYSAPSNMSEAEAKEWIAQRESGGDYGAVSPSGKYIGRYQLSKDKLNGDYSPENQEKTADSYVKNRYGSWAKAQEHWRKYGWY